MLEDRPTTLMTLTHTPTDTAVDMKPLYWYTPPYLVLAHLRSPSDDLLDESRVQFARQRGPELVKLCLC